MTHTCEIELRELSGFRDGILSADETSKLAAHLEHCSKCADRLADFDSIGAMLRERRALAAAEVAPNFAASVMDALPVAGAPAQERSWLRPWFKDFAEAVAAHRDAVLIGLGAIGLAAALLVVFAPGLRSQGNRGQDAVENEAEIHRLDVSGDERAMVLQSAEGNTVILLMTQPEDKPGAETPTVSP